MQGDGVGRWIPVELAMPWLPSCEQECMHDAPAPHFSDAGHVCVGVVTTPSPCSFPPFLLLFPLSAPPHLCSTRHLVLLPPSCLPFSPITFPFWKTVLVRSYLITLPCPPFLTKFLLFFAATPHAPASLPWGLLGWCHTNPAPSRVATTFSPAAPLVPSPGARSTTIVFSVHSFLQLHGCLLCTPTPARLSSPLSPSSQPISRAWPFPLVQRAKRGGTCFQQDFLLPSALGRGLLSRGSFV